MSSGSAQKPFVSVLTATIPERAGFLRECEASVNAQTWRGYEHRTIMDHNHEGLAVTMNKLASYAKGEWLLPLCDDDLLLPGCLETLLAHDHEGDMDVIYSPPLVTGNEDRWWFFQEPPAIPMTALIRVELWHALGGYDETLWHEEDRDLWLRMMGRDARFHRVNEPTWVYRQHSAQKSFNKVLV